VDEEKVEREYVMWKKRREEKKKDEWE